MRRNDPRWRTPFGSWLSRHTVAALQTDLGRAGQPVTRAAVYQWVAGVTVPRLPCAAAIVTIARGALTLEDLAQHRALVARGPQSPAR